MRTNPSVGPAAPVLAIAVVAALVAVCGYAATEASLTNQLYAIASIAWGQALLADLYAGFALIAGWIAWREAGRPVRAGAWIVALLLLGNVVAGVYVLLAWRAGGGDAAAFWLGQRP